jgi:pyruvate/2-oxoglutarate dehydrogenase complex dihydrolipoamide dehydrogenase (E3) component
MEIREDVDLLVVGGGKAGKSLAMDRAGAGWRVVMVERDKIGGICINVACIPTKALVGSARTLLAARAAARMGVEVDGDPWVSLDGLRRHETSVVGGMVSAHEQLFADSGMDFVLGTARFVDERTVEITAQDDDEPAVVHLDAGPVEAEAVGHRRRAGGDEELVAPQLGAVVGREHHVAVPRPAAHGTGPGAEPHVDALGP